MHPTPKDDNEFNFKTAFLRDLDELFQEWKCNLRIFEE